jgi:hypothetical protein
LKASRLLVVAVIVILVAVAGLYFAISSKPGTATSSTTVSGSSGPDVTIASDNVTIVGFQSGTWQLSLRNGGSIPVSYITAYLMTPTNAMICSGAQQSNGLKFENCPQVNGLPVGTPGNPLPPGTTVVGSASGFGPGSATSGTAYPVAVHVTFANGQTAWVNSTVTATG